MAARSFAYHAHGTADSDKSPWFVYHDKTLNQQCMLTQARLPMINHLTSFTTDHYTVAMSDPIPVRPEIMRVRVNMHSENALSAKGGLSITQGKLL